MAHDKSKNDRTAELDIDRKAKRRIPRQPVPKRPPEERIKDFAPAYIGYDAEHARREAERCLQCPDPQPCMSACPLHNDIPRAMWFIAQGDFDSAANVYRETSNFPEICGRVCPQDILCQGHCALAKSSDPVYLGKLESFVADYQRNLRGGFPLPEVAPPSGKMVAVVGSGPAGLACAEELVKRGHAVTVFEAMPRPGGLLFYGIPRFKLPRDIVLEKITFLEELGIRFICNTRVGRDVTMTQLLEQYDAVFLGTGTGVGAKIEVPGEDLKGIYQASDFLMKTNLPPEYLPENMRDEIQVGPRVAVIGGGDTAMDCVRSALRVVYKQHYRDGIEPRVTCYYRRTEAEMPGKLEERTFAREEGAHFEWLTAPIRFLGDEQGRVRAMECIRMQLGEPDASGRRRPVPVKGSEFIVEVDTVVLALGYWPDPILGETTPGLKTKKWGLIVADPATGETTVPGVYAGGDNVTGPDLVVTAMAAGRRAAAAIDEFLSRPVPAPVPSAPEPEQQPQQQDEALAGVTEKYNG
jgi:glutamate synthase (NADPH/NADH) small chain